MLGIGYRIRRVVLERPIPLLGALAVASAAVVLWHVTAVRNEAVESTAVEDARFFSQVLTEFRTLYTSEIVEALTQQGIVATHDYEERPGTIPLPATLSMKLGERIGSYSSGAKARLYSPFPFPWRKTEGGLRDGFALDAWSHLSDRPQEPFYRFEVVEDRLSLRYATADLMRPSCVGCHNAHPESPRAGWKTGDLRGVLEVRLPLEAAIIKTNAGLGRTASRLAVMAGLALAGLALVVTTFRRSSREAQELAAETERVNRELEHEMADRKRAEEDQRRMEERIEQAQKLESLGVLSGGIAHDFNNLLTPILGNVELAQADVPEGSPAHHSLEEIGTAAIRAADLCRQLLAYSGKRALVNESIDLNLLVEEMAHLLEVSTSKKCGLAYDLAPQLPAVDGDATQLRQIVLNLITNASEAIGDRTGVITLSTGTCERAAVDSGDPILNELPEGGTCVYLEVSDTGDGMDAETRKRIFDPFFTTKFAGRGLGLAAVLGIVRGHRGALVVASDPGRTRFRVLFPAAVRVTIPLAETTSETASWRGTGTILLADDEGPVRRVVRRMLEAAGFEVLVASDGEEAVELFRQHASSVVCVLLDLTMPRMDGSEALRAIRQVRDGVPVILCSGYDERDVISRVEGDGSTGFLHKPFQASELRSALRAALPGASS